MRIYFIYTLTDRKTGCVIYVGKTADPVRRKRDHEKENIYTNPEFKIIDKVCADNLFNGDLLEEYWINKHLSWGEPLMNKRSIHPDWIDDYDFYKRPRRKVA